MRDRFGCIYNQMNFLQRSYRSNLKNKVSNEKQNKTVDNFKMFEKKQKQQKIVLNNYSNVTIPYIQNTYLQQMGNQYNKANKILIDKMNNMNGQMHSDEFGHDNNLMNLQILELLKNCNKDSLQNKKQNYVNLVKKGKGGNGNQQRKRNKYGKIFKEDQLVSPTLTKPSITLNKVQNGSNNRFMVKNKQRNTKGEDILKDIRLMGNKKKDNMKTGVQISYNDQSSFEQKSTNHQINIDRELKLEIDRKNELINSINQKKEDIQNSIRKLEQQMNDEQVEIDKQKMNQDNSI